MIPQKEILGLTIYDFEISQIFDHEGYHRDINVCEFKDNGKGLYSMKIKDLGRSDKTVPETIK